MCLTYLLSKDFGTGSLKSDSSMSGTSLPIDDDTVLRKLIERVADYPFLKFLKYAVILWGRHVQGSVEGIGQGNTINPATMKVACQFLEKLWYLEHWFQLYTFLEYSEVHRSQKGNGLHVACLMDLLAEFLLDRGANIESNNNNFTRLYLAVLARRRDMVELLLDRGADTEGTVLEGLTALHLAAGNGDEGTTKLLLSRGAAGCDNNWTPCHVAALLGYIDVLRLFTDHRDGILVDQCGGLLQNAVLGRNMVLGLGVGTSATSSRGCTALHTAASEEHRYFQRTARAQGRSTSSRQQRMVTYHLCLAKPSSSSYRETFRTRIYPSRSLRVCPPSGAMSIHALVSSIGW